MALTGGTRCIILFALILILGIIHLGVGIGIVARYHRYKDTFQPQISLSGYNIFIALCTIALGILGLVSVIAKNMFLRKCNLYLSHPLNTINKRDIFIVKITAIAALAVGILALASLIAALALSAESAGDIHDSLTDNMNKYTEDEDAMALVDNIQTTYQCCGVNIWLDWARIQLNVGTSISNVINTFMDLSKLSIISPR